MKTTPQIMQILQEAKPDLIRSYGLRRLALFGSCARGEQTEGSDVDVLVEVDAAIGLRFVELADRLEALLGLPAHVVSRRAISPRHWTVIMKDLVDVQ